MIHSPSDEINRVLSLMPDCWRDDYKLAQAQDAARVNRALALDQAPPGSSLDADIRRFFNEGPDQMPPSPTGAAMMPPSLNDNYTGSSGGHRTVGGMNYHRRNDNASDQITTAEQLLNAFSALPEEVQFQIFQALASHYGVEIGGEAEAEDESSPMQFSNGAGTAPHELISPEQTMSATFAERDDLTSPRGTMDARPRTARDRRMAQDSIDRRYQNQKSFDQRFGALVAHVDVWR